MEIRIKISQRRYDLDRSDNCTVLDQASNGRDVGSHTIPNCYYDYYYYDHGHCYYDNLENLDDNHGYCCCDDNLQNDHSAYDYFGYDLSDNRNRYFH